MAVAYDAVASSPFTTSGSTCSWSHTLGGSATDLVVIFTMCGNGGAGYPVLSSVKCGTTPMTVIGTVNNDNVAADGTTYAYGLTNPPTGAQTITITATGASFADTGAGPCIGGSISFTGSGGYGTAYTAFGASAAPSVAVTSTTSGNMVCAGMGNGNGTTSSANTSRFINNGDTNSGNGNAAGATAASTGASVTMSWTVPSGDWGVVAFEVLNQPLAPSVDAQGGGSGGSTIGYMTAEVNPEAQDTMVLFDYGTTSGYGSTTSNVDIGSGSADVFTSATLTGLTASTTYHFRASATNATGTTNGADQTFTTAAAPTSSGILGQGQLGALGLGWEGINYSPASPTPVPPVQVVTPTHTRRRGILRYLRGTTPAAPVSTPVPPVTVVTTHARRRGVVRFLQGKIYPQPPVVVQTTHQRRKGRSLFLRGPVNPVPEPNVTVVATHQRRRGSVQYLRGTTPATFTPLPSITVVTPTHTRRRGVSKFLKGPINPVPQVPVVVVSTHQRRRGRALFLKGPVNPVPVPQVVVKATHQRRRGLVQYLRGTTPVTTAPVPPVHVVTPTHVRRRGISKFLRGPVNPVAIPPVTVVTPTHTRRRGVLAYLRGLVGVAPVAPVPTEFTASPPIPYWTTAPPRPWWEAGNARGARWEVGEPLVAWSATQALFQPLSEEEAAVFGAGIFGAGVFGSGVAETTGSGVEAQQPGPVWQTGEPRT